MKCMGEQCGWYIAPCTKAKVQLAVKLDSKQQLTKRDHAGTLIEGYVVAVGRAAAVGTIRYLLQVSDCAKSRPLRLCLLAHQSHYPPVIMLG